jgi:hypothetical protein
MDKGKLTKDRQHQGQRESDKSQIISCPKGNWLKTDNIMDVSFTLAMMLSVFCQFRFVNDIVCLLSVSLWPWYCLSLVSFPLSMILSVFCQFPFGYDVVCLLSVFLWP